MKNTRDSLAEHYIDKLIKKTGCLPSEIESMRELLRVVLIEDGFNAGWDALAKLVMEVIEPMEHTTECSESPLKCICFMGPLSDLVRE